MREDDQRKGRAGRRPRPAEGPPPRPSDRRPDTRSRSRGSHAPLPTAVLVKVSVDLTLPGRAGPRSPRAAAQARPSNASSAIDVRVRPSWVGTLLQDRSTSPAFTYRPGSTATLATTPPRRRGELCSIFMASRTTRTRLRDALARHAADGEHAPASARGSRRELPRPRHREARHLMQPELPSALWPCTSSREPSDSDGTRRRGVAIPSLRAQYAAHAAPSTTTSTRSADRTRY